MGGGRATATALSAIASTMLVLVTARMSMTSAPAALTFASLLLIATMVEFRKGLEGTCAGCSCLGGTWLKKARSGQEGAYPVAGRSWRCVWSSALGEHAR
jgi:hypothetical protein